MGCILISAGLLPPGKIWMLAMMIVILSIGVYGVRGIYFALVAESGTPVAITGTAIGLISTFGFLPDVFMGPLSGYFLDYYPGETGHRLLFATVGLICAGRFCGIHMVQIHHDERKCTVTD